MPRIDIVRIDETVSFRPEPARVLVGEEVFWRNLDGQEPHWITRQGRPQDFFLDTQLAPFSTAPADTSGSIVVRQADLSVGYVCSIHGEAGTFGSKAFTELTASVGASGAKAGKAKAGKAKAGKAKAGSRMGKKRRTTRRSGERKRTTKVRRKPRRATRRSPASQSVRRPAPS